MSLITPINLQNWVPNTVISSNEVKAEFINVYSTINGQLDSENIRDNSITGAKLADESITATKIQSVSASKIIGMIGTSNLPTNLLTTTGGDISGTLIFNVVATKPLLKSNSNDEVILLETGTDPNKIRVIIGGTTLIKITLNGVTQWSIDKSAVETPVKFKIPVV